MSCNLLYEPNVQLLGLLQWNSVTRTFGMSGVLPLSTFVSGNVSIPEMRESLIIAEDCLVMAYTNVQTFQSAVYRATADWSSVNVVGIPAQFQPVAVSNDLMYVISNHKLFRYHQVNYDYEELYTFEPHVGYMIHNFRDRVVVQATVSSLLDANSSPYPTYNTNLDVFFFEYETHSTGNLWKKLH